MKLRRTAVAVCILLSVILAFCACTDASVTPQKVLADMCRAEKPLPAGQTYLLSALPESDAYLSPELLAACFGKEGKIPIAMDGVQDAAFFFSYRQPCEIDVFLCKSSAETEAVAKMCLHRLDALRNYFEGAETCTEEAVAYLQNACVTVRGRWVVLCVSSDTDAVLRAFRRLL